MPSELEDDKLSTLERRKLRNRLSQRAFRERQALRIKELEDQLDNTAAPESERNAKLLQENAALRDKLLECQKQLDIARKSFETLSMSIKGVLSGVTAAIADDLQTIGSKTNDYFTPTVEDQSTGTTSVEKADAEALTNPAQSHHVNAIEPTGLNEVFSGIAPLDVEEIPTELEAPGTLSSYQQNNEVAFPAVPHIPLSPSIDGWTSMMNPNFISFHGPSSLNDHMVTLERSLRFRTSLSAVHEHSLTSSISLMLKGFFSLSRPAMATWWALTRGYQPLIDFLLYRLTNSPQIYERMLPAFRPTSVQLTIPHPSVIDWFPFPLLRDRLIMCYASHPSFNMDQIVLDLSAAYVAEVDLGALVQGVARGTQAYLSLWELSQFISSERSFSTATNIHRLPAPDVQSLFTKEYAPLVFKALKVTNGMVECKVAPAFFNSNPELCDAAPGIVASGIPLRAVRAMAVPDPDILDVTKYEDLATWAFESCAAR